MRCSAAAVDVAKVSLSLRDDTHFAVSNRFNVQLNDVYRKHGGEFKQEGKAAMRGAVWRLPPIPHHPSPEDAFAFLEQKIPLDLLRRLLPYQRAGVMMAVQRAGRVLIGDEMGLGKTVQALVTALFYQHEWPLLVICPSSLKMNWMAEVQRWLGLEEDSVCVIASGKDRCAALVCIAPYDLLARSPQVLGDQEYRVIIADESHYLKSSDAKRTQVHALQPTIFRGAVAFGQRYCNAFQGPFGWDFTGSSHLDELSILLLHTVLIRRLKKDVLQDLPPKVRQQVFIEQKDAKLKREIAALSEASTALDRRLQSSVGDTRALDNEKRTLMMKLYGLTGLAKLPAALDYLDELIIERECKTLVFAHHQNVLDGIANHFFTKKIRHIRIDGSTPPGIRQELCDRFQDDGACRAALLSITAAGIGLTLHAASSVVFAELFWNPGQIQQAEDRAHRIGQTCSVDIKFLVCKGTLDDVMWSILQSKLSVIGRSIAGETGLSVTAQQLPEAQLSQRRLEEYFAQIAPPSDFVAAPTATATADGAAEAPDIVITKTTAAAIPAGPPSTPSATSMGSAGSAARPAPATPAASLWTSVVPSKGAASAQGTETRISFATPRPAAAAAASAGTPTQAKHTDEGWLDELAGTASAGTASAGTGAVGAKRQCMDGRITEASSAGSGTKKGGAGGTGASASTWGGATAVGSRGETRGDATRVGGPAAAAVASAGRAAGGASAAMQVCEVCGDIFADVEIAQHSKKCIEAMSMDLVCDLADDDF